VPGYREYLARNDASCSLKDVGLTTAYPGGSQRSDMPVVVASRRAYASATAATSKTR